MDELEFARILRERGALLEGHFLLSSGKHSDRYVEKARIFEDPLLVRRFGEEIASWYEDVQTVVSPAVGAIPLGFAVAMAAGARFVYAEREAGVMSLRRGFYLEPGERVLVVEDVVTTGGSAAEVYEVVRSSGAEALGVAAMVDRSRAEMPFPLRALVRVDAETFEPEDCPLCKEGLPVEAPGSRHL
ncbi:MAG TPA: orotate phosphoribosyltransferase [Actinomycetota bacterium]|jgi:orotate phosphoribosyltransferase|nr:orotate phosphoribosyltransferase [Actinomycetota bacterium]